MTVDELMHYGVLGMKWGVRRSQDELDRINGRAYDFQKTENGYVLKKGSTVHRVTTDPDNEKEGYAYIYRSIMKTLRVIVKKLLNGCPKMIHILRLLI